MKGVVFLGDRKLELRDFPDPTPGLTIGKESLPLDGGGIL